MNDVSPENQEYFAAPELNDFHSSAEAKELSADSSSEDSSEKTIERTGNSVTPHVSVSLIAGGATTTVAVVTGVLVLAPSVSSLPSISSLTLEESATSVSYSFQCSYSGSGSLLVKLTSAFSTLTNTIDLPAKESSSSVVTSSTDSSSSASSSPIEARFAGAFSSLTSGTDYVLTIQAPFTGGTYTTLSQKNVTTLAKAVQVGFDQLNVDYSKSELVYTLKSEDPTSLPGMNELHLHLSGLDGTGAEHEEETPLAGAYSDNQVASLAGFKKGYYLRLTLLGANGDNSAGDPAKKYAETALYY
jgi:hypothetical protein